ncbi:MAG: metal-dependent hydrolase [Halovenus sp.]|uniref:metal-dependent hydrolase n=1 Tax=Halovenus amylolytica TaxID=2500550 RepID=UPI000FE3405C
MTSTIVHIAFALLIAAALLGAAFDWRSVLIVVIVTALPDLDSFIALYTVAGHRTVLHNVWLGIVPAIALWADLTIREQSIVRRRWGPWGIRVAWVSIGCYLFAHVGLDLVDGVANLFWPVHDQFYRLTGSIELSSQRGIVQTFVDGDGFLLFEPEGTTRELDITTGVDPAPTDDGSTPDRTFPVIGAGWELVVVVTGVLVTAARFQLSEEKEKF